MPAAPAPTRRRRGIAVPRLSRLRLDTSTAEPRADHDAILEVESATREVEARDRLFRRSLAYADVLSAAFALILCTSVLGDDSLRPATFFALPIIVLVGKVQGMYDRDELVIRKTTMDEAPQLFHLATLYALLLWILDDQLIDGQLGDKQVLVLWLALFGFALLARQSARSIVGRFATVERCLFIGDAVAYERLTTKLEGDGVKAQLVGRMSLQRPNQRGDRGATAQELRELISWTGAHRIIIETHALPAEEMLDFVRAAKSVGVRVSLVPRVLDVVGSSVVFDQVQGVTLLGVRRFGLTRSSRVVKRGFDFCGAALALLVAAPVMAAIALAIRLDSRGPVFFRQTRVGRDGKHFRIFKFRTMCTDAEQRKAELLEANEADGLFKIADDPRVTRVGRFLRRTSLDELPQLFNVITGDMSLVGPRPLILDEDEQITGWDRRRLQLTPGMTGHWQILGSARVPLHEMVKIDYLYVAGWSLWADVKILLRTVPYMLRRRGM
ncbi:MAG TPA: exopolysaccharide biosynthesis polyprenyl glycosylphosphotransferase [Solirubrobacteraceae bacterium]|jgi:exopolysaccharide biosynthesis polyprenyl glycosylphosphotransferase